MKQQYTEPVTRMHFVEMESALMAESNVKDIKFEVQVDDYEVADEVEISFD